MSKQIVVGAESRKDQGKGASRRLRHAGKVPAILYGGKGEPSNITLDQLKLSAQVGYWMGNGAQPYAGVTYLGDRRKSSLAGADPIGKQAWQWALGMNFFSLSRGINAGIAATWESSRSNQKSGVLTGNIGMRF